MLKAETVTGLEGRLQELADLFIYETSDMQGWKDLLKAERRGDAYWGKKNARATLSLVASLHTLLERAQQMRSGPSEEEDEELEREIALTTEQADALIAKVKKRGKAG